MKDDQSFLHSSHPLENVLSSYARGRDGQLLHQPEQTVPDGVPASRAPPQHHQGQLPAAAAAATATPALTSVTASDDRPCDQTLCVCVYPQNFKPAGSSVVHNPGAML